MPDYSKRTGYAPWSLTREAGVQSATVNGTIDVPQTCQPTINTGVIDEKGNWQGVKADDEVFIGLSKAEGVANGSAVFFPDTNNHPSIDMTGFSVLQFALKTNVGGQYGIVSRFGPDTVPFANLSPIASAEQIRIIDSLSQTDETIIDDSNVNVAPSDAWEIFTILGGRAKGQKNLQFQITNSTGSIVNLEFGFRRLV